MLYLVKYQCQILKKRQNNDTPKLSMSYSPDPMNMLGYMSEIEGESKVA